MNGISNSALSGILLALTVGAYIPLWQNDFVDFDDDNYITENPRVRDGLSASSIWWSVTNCESPYRMPVTWISLQFDAHFFSDRSSEGAIRLSPQAFHGHNLFWHACCVLMLFALWRRLTGSQWRSFLVAALFAVHPMHVESVAWAIERKDVLMCFFGLVAIRAYVWYVEKPGVFRYGVTTLAFVLSLLSKPMLMTLPIVLLLLDYWPLRRLDTVRRGNDPSGGDDLPRLPPRKLLIEKLPMFTLGMMVVAILTESRSGTTLVDLPVLDRAVNALAGYGWYVSATIWPSGLAVLYPHPRDEWTWSTVIMGAGLLTTVSALAVWRARRWPWPFVGWFWFVGTLLPVIGLAQGGAQAWADRFSYWPHIGLFVALVWGLDCVARQLKLPRLVVGTISMSALMVLAAITWSQLAYWKNAISLWERALSVTTNNAPAHERLSSQYRKVGRETEALEHTEEAARIRFNRIRRHMHAAN
jgi:hypothetical protein